MLVSWEEKKHKVWSESEIRKKNRATECLMFHPEPRYSIDLSEYNCNTQLSGSHIWPEYSIGLLQCLKSDLQHAIRLRFDDSIQRPSEFRT